VLLAVPWDNVPETLASLPKWKNQILIDGTNPFHGKAGNFTLASQSGEDSASPLSSTTDAPAISNDLLKESGFRRSHPVIRDRGVECPLKDAGGIDESIDLSIARPVNRRVC
jgi:hypothetical protein